jgi:Silicon transporter
MSSNSSNEPTMGRQVLDYFKYGYSTCLLFFSIVVVMYAIGTEQTTATNIPIAVAVILFWMFLYVLAILEGTQGAIVGLLTVVPSRYQQTHPRTYKITELISNELHHPDKSDDHETYNRLERYIIGRQFLVVLVVFVLSSVSSAAPGATLFDTTDSSFLDIITTIFLTNGIAAILVTITIGQLISQIISANCMLDFLNQRIIVSALAKTSLLVESSGLLHAVYLLQRIMMRFTGQDTTTSDDKPASATTMSSSFFFWIRVVFSVVILIFSFVVTLTALVQNKTKMWDGVPVPVSIILFIGLMMVVGMLEGLQIALFAVVRRTDLKDHRMAYQNSQLILSTPEKLPAFLIGRQILVTVCMFIVARITAINVDLDVEGANIWGVSDGVQYFFNTGLLGAVITTIMASLIWRVIAASYPVAFLSNPLVYVLIRMCFYLEMSGICSSAWWLAFCYKKALDYHVDETFLGEKEDENDMVENRNQDNDLDLEASA